MVTQWMTTLLPSPPDRPVVWEAEVIGTYHFENAKLGERCRVTAQTAFAALRKAEPLLGVAKEHLKIRMIEDEMTEP
jgi:hypothetical protein